MYSDALGVWPLLQTQEKSRVDWREVSLEKVKGSFIFQDFYLPGHSCSAAVCQSCSAAGDRSAGKRTAAPDTNCLQMREMGFSCHVSSEYRQLNAPRVAIGTVSGSMVWVVARRTTEQRRSRACASMVLILYVLLDCLTKMTIVRGRFQATS